MNRIDTLSACHHRFRFLLEELSDESGDFLKKSRLVEEFQNEIDVYCSVSASFFMDSANKKYGEQYEIQVKNGENIKRRVIELDPMTNDLTKWNIQVMRLKEEVENLLFQFEKSIESNVLIT